MGSAKSALSVFDCPLQNDNEKGHTKKNFAIIIMSDTNIDSSPYLCLLSTSLLSDNC